MSSASSFSKSRRYATASRFFLETPPRFLRPISHHGNAHVADVNGNVELFDEKGGGIDKTKGVWRSEGISLLVELKFDKVQVNRPIVCLENKNNNNNGRKRKAEKCDASKRKKNQIDRGNKRRWTKEQELSLDKAVLSIVKPTPKLWKNVAKLTPRPRQARPRAKRTVPSCTPPSANKLLFQPGPDCKKHKFNKNKSHRSWKIPRELLQMQYQVDQGQAADLFSVFEPEAASSADASTFSIPELSHEKSHVLERYSNVVTVSSPLVLKNANPTMHVKYVVHLHRREAKRIAAAAKSAKSGHKEMEEKENRIPKMNPFEAAKASLRRSANDAIWQYQQKEVNAILRNRCPDDDDICFTGEEEDEG